MRKLWECMESNMESIKEGKVYESIDGVMRVEMGRKLLCSTLKDYDNIFGENNDSGFVAKFIEVCQPVNIPKEQQKDTVVAIESDPVSGIKLGHEYQVVSNDIGMGVIAVRELGHGDILYCSPHLFDLKQDYEGIYKEMTTEPEIPEKVEVDLPHDPAHYKQGGIETIDYMRAKMTPEQFEGWLIGNVLEYMSRFGFKDEKYTNAMKAYTYLGWLLEELEK